VKGSISENNVLAALQACKSKLLPSGKHISTDAIAHELRSRREDKVWIKKNFSKLVEGTQSTAYEIYLRHERASVSRAFREVLAPLLPARPSSSDFFDMLDRNFSPLDKFFLSLSQSRRARAGKAFEHVMRELFTLLAYPYTPHPVINGRPDFLLPSKSHFDVNAMDCLIFTVKRTLRERWRQIVTEGTRGYLFFLATIDEKISSKQLGEIQNHRIYVVVPERIRHKTYPNERNVISFETFFDEHLDPAMKRWCKNKVI